MVRSNEVTFQGNPMTLLGPKIEPGQIAPAFTVTANDLSDLKSATYAGKVVLLSVVPSLDTSVCATQTKRFNQEATKLGQDVVVLTISMDLPFAQKRFRGTEGIERVITGSDYKHRAFGEAYGVLIQELGLLARSVFVIGRDGRVTYAQYVSEMTHEPEYAPVLAAVAQARK